MVGFPLQCGFKNLYWINNYYYIHGAKTLNCYSLPEISVEIWTCDDFQKKYPNKVFAIIKVFLYGFLLHISL